MPNTPKLGLPYPVLPDPADVPQDMGELAEMIDARAGSANGLATLDAGGKVPTGQLPVAPAAIPATIVDARGDLIVGLDPDAPARLAAGGEGSVLTRRGAEPLGLAWETIVVSGIAASILVQKGDLIAARGNADPVRLPSGPNGQTLIADSAEPAGLKWGAPPASSGIPNGIVDAKGDLIAGTAVDTPARVPVGAEGQVLTARAAAAAGIAWEAPPSGLPTPTGHEGEWLKVVGGAAVWSPQYDVPLDRYTAKGALLAGAAAADPQPLAPGTNGHLLTADSAAALGVKWAAAPASGIPPTLVDAKGDLVGATANDTPARVPVGTDGQVLLADASQALGIRWSDPPGVDRLTIAAKVASYTLVLTDAGKMIELANAAAVTLTVPTNAAVAFPIGTQIHFMQTGAGVVTVTPAGGVTINARPGLKTAGQWASGTLLKRAADSWVCMGNTVP